MRRILTKVPQAIGFHAYFAMELLRANIRVARDVLRPLRHLRPGIVAVPIELDSDIQITILSTLITLTPGTLTLDVSTDRKTIYIHAMDAHDPDKLRAQLKGGFERRVKELFS
jgi:multicomponent Na+:H+ antiporter subunit E